MWVLISQEDSNVKYTLLCGQDYRIGRADADILLATDKSISRSHAFLKITHLDVTQPHKLPILTLTDSSRFGSVVAGEKFKGGTKDVNSGDIIKFGTQNSTFKAWYDSFVITTSCLDESGKREMKQFMLTLGGHVVKEWRKECKLLVMSQLSVTVKVICALIDQRPIVTPKYLVSLIAALKTNSKEPDEDEFLPPIAESQLNPNEVSFKRDERRKTLFQGKVFIFLSPKQFKKLSMAVELAGGTPMLMEEGTDNNEDDFLISPDTCVMYSDMNDRSTNYSQNAKDWAHHVENLLKRNKKRTINDAELGYAVLYCSTQKHCNPDVADTGEAVVPLPSQSLTVAPITSQVSEQRDKVRVSETQQTTARSRRSTAGSNKSNVSVVDNSFVPDTEKRKSSSGTSAVDSPARPTRSNISAVVKETPSQKRKRELEDVDDVPEPKVSKKGQIEVKKEPITPLKSATPISATTRLTRASERSALQGATNRNTKGGGASVKAETLSDDDERKETHNGRRRGRSSRSPSPAAPEVVTRSKRSPARKAPKVEIDVSQDVDAMFDSIPSRRRLRRERSPSPKPVIAKVESPKPTRSRVAPVLDSCTNIDDAFDTIPSRRRGRRSPSPDPVLMKPESSQKDTRTRVVPVIEENPNIGDGFDNMPGRRGRTARQRSPTPPPKPANLKTTDSPVPKSGPQRNQKQNVKVKSEPVTPAKPTIAELNRPNIEANDRMSDVPTGYLTTTKPIQDQRCKIDQDYKIDDPVERGAMVVKEISMVVPANNRPQGRNRQTNLSDGTCMWKGKVVKNFKKFRKTANAGTTGLPRIIGGSDLIVHKDAPNKDKEQWLQELAEAESQQNEQEEIARQLFDWEPSSRRGKVGRR